MHLRTGNQGSARFDGGMHHLHLVAEDGSAERIDLGFSGSRLLARLLQNPGEVVAREELIAYAWPERVVGQGSLNQQIYTLRQILGDEKNREIIQTLPRRGYLFNPEHVLSEEPAADPLETPQPPMTSVEPDAPLTRQKPTVQNPRPGLRWLAPGAALITTFAALGVNLYSPLSQDDSRFHVGNLEVLLLEPDAEERRHLTEVMRPTLERLTRHANGRSRIALSQASDYYALHCIHGTRSYTLSSHRGQLAHISDASLQRCLQ